MRLTEVVPECSEALTRFFTSPASAKTARGASMIKRKTTQLVFGLRSHCASALSTAAFAGCAACGHDPGSHASRTSAGFQRLFAWTWNSSTCYAPCGIDPARTSPISLRMIDTVRGSDPLPGPCGNYTRFCGVRRERVRATGRIGFHWP